MRNTTGAPVTGDDFFGREEELSRLRRAAEGGNHVLLSAPRRVGKSSLVLRLCDVLTADGWNALRCNVEQCSDEAAFVRALLSDMAKAGLEVPGGVRLVEGIRRSRGLFGGTKVQASGVGVELSSDEADVWRKLAAAVQVVLADARGRVLVAVDELPIFLGKLADSEDGPQRVRSILDWLRALRQSPENGAVWVITGSVGLDGFVERRGLERTINDLTPQPLGAYSGEVAVRALKALGDHPDHRLQMTDEVCAAIIERVGWPLPFYLQLLFAALRDRVADGRAAPDSLTADDVAAAYEDLLQPHHYVRFSPWDSRLEQQFDLPADAGVARFVLAHVCRSARGCSRGKLYNLVLARQPNADPDALERRLRSILVLLERDGYLIAHGSTYAFRAILLRDFWKRRFVQ